MLLITTGEPAGIGPDVSLMLASQGLPVVLLGSRALLSLRAALLGIDCCFEDYQGERPQFRAGLVVVWDVPLAVPSIAGQLNPKNSDYVLQLLRLACKACRSGEFHAMVTAPIHKGVINQAGHAFSGHTEFLAAFFEVEQVVMMLACDTMRVALVTTHIPLSEVPAAITAAHLRQVISVLHRELQTRFNLAKPQIYIAGLNPHAGEQGYLGREEIEVIEPVIASLQAMDLHGPLPADTLFTPHNIERADVFLAMYHDQGLSVLKYAGFGEAVNITLGLPIIRTSVDHGTALALAGTGKASEKSLQMAVNTAFSLSKEQARCY